MLENTLRTRGLHAGVRFAPPATLDKQHKQKFQLKCSEGFDWRRQEYGETAWSLQAPQSEGDTRSQLKLTLQREAINFEDFFPTGSLEMFNDNLKMALGAVAEVFSPRLLLASGVVVRFTAQADGGDARHFLGHRALHLESKLAPLGRPVHAIGLKFLLPPIAGENQPVWQAEVKVESLIEDYRQLFIEVDAKWGHPVAWDLNEVTSRVRIAHEFAIKQVIAFLTQFGADAAE